MRTVNVTDAVRHREVCMELFDFHCHIDLMPSMINFARDVAKTNINVLTVTTTPKAFEKEIEILKQFSNIKVGLGLHPQLVSSRYRELSLVKELITGADYIGEIGLDFNRQFYFSKEKQIESCLFQRAICSCEFYFHYLCLNVFTKATMIWILK